MYRIFLPITWFAREKVNVFNNGCAVTLNSASKAASIFYCVIWPDYTAKEMD
jgi:hypothetical protein